ncbi:S53 family peptidase [Actinocatenispora comari]|uniref:Kumamolisin n=1 Tax=Actinocatenispora comari TaxID=2807577 RepID=A0A8J4EP97_9ACTN|nr:S53 family peptidase [Actinocatenispora comari]GIL30608.1 kumamolisin [Actinocatenispora comari]
MTDEAFVPVPGSRRGAALPHAQESGRLDDAERLETTLVLRRRSPLPAELVTGSATVTRAEFADRYGADPADVEAVRSALTGQGLEIVSVDPASRRIVVGGPLATQAAVFGARLSRMSAPNPFDGGTVAYRHREGELRLPAALAGVVTAVLGLDDRPQARAAFRVAAAEATTASFTPPQLGTVYGFPTDVDGTGQTVAIIELGGGFAQADLDAYFGELQLTPPTVTAAGVDGGQNRPGGDPSGADGEVLLDIEVVGGLAPGAHQIVYFAPNTDQGFLDAVSTAIHADPTPVAVSISWGASEDQWTEQARTSFDQALADAAALGVTVTAAAGDGGSADGATDGTAHTDFPASSPHVLACGGTSLTADASTGAVRAETVWNSGSGGGATGGGVSTAFDLPSWQQQVGVPAGPNGGAGRGVPDVAADADPATGYRVRVDGKDLVIGGTSAVAPLWAALLARLAQRAGHGFGLVQPTLYGTTAAGAVAPGFRDVTTGGNGAYEAGPGWDACTGLGVPTAALADVLTASGAGTPPGAPTGPGSPTPPGPAATAGAA